MKAAYAFGFSCWNLAVAATTLNEIGPPRISVEEITLRTPGLAISRWMNGGDVKWLLISPAPDRKAAMPSLWVMETVSGSSLVMPASPNSLLAQICSMIACIETLTAGRAILSLSVKSRMPLMCGLRVFSCNGRKLNPDAAFTCPLVLAQMVAMPGTPRQTKSTLLESSASFITSLERKVAQLTLTSPRPCARACFSTIFWSSITIICR